MSSGAVQHKRPRISSNCPIGFGGKIYVLLETPTSRRAVYHGLPCLTVAEKQGPASSVLFATVHPERSRGSYTRLPRRQASSREGLPLLRPSPRSRKPTSNARSCIMPPCWRTAEHDQQATQKKHISSTSPEILACHGQVLDRRHPPFPSLFRHHEPIVSASRLPLTCPTRPSPAGDKRAGRSFAAQPAPPPGTSSRRDPPPATPCASRGKWEPAVSSAPQRWPAGRCSR